MNPYKLREIYKYLTRAKKVQPDLPDVFPASKAPIPAKTKDVEEIEAINRFMRNNPRTEKAGGGMLVQPSVDGSRPGYNGNIGQQKVSKEVSKSSKNINKNINKWATNWFNKNQKNYGVRDFKKMKNDFTSAWSTELTENFKKYEGYGATKKTLKMSDSGLPIIKDGISIDGIKFVTRADRPGNNPDLAWERLFYKNKLKNKDFKTQLKQYVEWATANKRKNPNLLDPNVKFGSAAQSKTGTLEYGKKFKGFNDDVIFFMGDVLNKKSLNPGGTIKGVTDVFKETLGKDADNYFKKFKGSWNVWVDNFRAVGKLAGLDDSMIDALLKKQTSDTQKIMKLYNVENLPLEFKVAQDHLFGLAEAKALGDPKIASQTLKNLVASTREQNRVLGQEGFSNKRVSLIKKFKNSNLENKANIINQLNTLADEYVPGRLKYNIKKDGSLKITNLQPEATLKAKTSAYKSITETFPKNILEIVRKNKAQAITNAAIKTASVGGFDEKLKVLCGGKAFGGRVGLANGTDPFCPAARQDPEGFLKKLTADGDIGKFFRSAKAVNVAKNVARLSLDAANPFTLLGGEIFYVGLDSANNVSKGLDFDEALDKAFIFYDFDTFDSKILERAKNQGFDENQMNLLRSTLNINKLDNRQKGIEKQFELDESDISGLTSDLTRGSEKDYAKVNKQIADESDKYINSLDKMGFDLSKDESYNTGFNYLNNLFKKKTQSELLKSYENRKRKLDPEGGAIGDVLKPIFDTQSYTQPLKFALDIVNPFTRNVGFESDRAKEQRYLNEMDPRELYLYNKERGFTLDDIQAGTSPFVNKAMEDRSQSEAALGKGLFQNYAGGGIAKLAGVSSGVAPVRGPNPQGLPGLLKRGIKI